MKEKYEPYRIVRVSWENRQDCLYEMFKIGYEPIAIANPWYSHEIIILLKRKRGE